MGPPAVEASSRERTLAALACLLAALGAGCVEIAPPDEPPEQPAGCGSGPACIPPERCVDNQACEVPGPASCTREGDPACGDSEHCTVVEGSSCAQASCAAPTTCRAPVGETEGLFACATDVECASGRCAGGVCLRVCSSSADCPARFGCGSLTLPGGLEVQGCLGKDRAGAADPALTLCRSSESCTAGRVCRIRAMPGSEGGFGETEAVCEAAPGGATGAPGRGCGGPDACEGGICVRPCSVSGTFPDVCAGFRCSRPCESDAGCPSPFTCGGTLEGTEVRYCSLPNGGCFDDSDCCPRLDGAGACLGGWETGETACATAEIGGRSQRLCSAPDGLGRYAACSAPADCASGICAGSAGCASPCMVDEDRCGGPGQEECRSYAGSEAAAVCVDLSRCTNDDDCSLGPCDAGACLCWHAYPGDSDSSLRACAAQGLDHVNFLDPDTTPTGDGLCAAAGAGACSRVTDATCAPLACSEPAGPGRMALCRCSPAG